MEKRAYPIEIRAIEGENGEVRGMEGVASITNVWSHPLPLFGTTFREKLEPGAFDGVDISNVKAYFNHDRNQMLARTNAGTLSVTVTDEGIKYSIPEIAPTTHGNNLKVHLKRNEVKENSFAFMVKSKEDGDEIDGDRWKELKDGTYERTIIRGGVKLLDDVSPVIDAAYPETSLSIKRQLEHRASKATGRNETIKGETIEKVFDSLDVDNFELIEIEGRKMIAEIDREALINKKKSDSERAKQLDQNRLKLLQLNK